MDSTIVDGLKVRAQVRVVLILGLSTGCHHVVTALAKLFLNLSSTSGGSG